MKNKLFKVLILLLFTSFSSCSQISEAEKKDEAATASPKIATVQTEPHQYGGWYCPDNLNGFPAVDIKDWQNVPVVNGRLATQEETQNGASLILVDTEKYPNAKVLDMTMPRLATQYSRYSKREELIIIIQALNIDNDSIVGFRYLNGGNGSARLSEIRFLTDNEVDKLTQNRFVTLEISIAAAQETIWKILTDPNNVKSFQPIFDRNNKLKTDWRKKTNVNYHYPSSGILASGYADILFGNYYIQNDYDNANYTEKFLLLENEETKQTELKIVCGPYGDDFESQKSILLNWGQKVKQLSEG